MSEAKVVFMHGVSPAVLKAITSLNPEGFTTVPVEVKVTPEESQIEAVRDADFILWFSAKLSERVLRAAGRARLVQGLSAGYDSIDLRLLRELDIPCANNGGANSWAVADQAVLAMLTLLRKLPQATRSTREGRWRAAIDGTNTFEMAGKLVGIMGFGNIGRKVARRVQAFDARVQYYDRFPLPPARERELDVTRVSLEELFRTSDILTCHAPLTNDTRHVVNRRRLATMKPSAIFVNTSRGEVVDEAALHEALTTGKVAGAGLDVFEREPVDPANPLLALDNVVASPHTAGTTWDTWFRRAGFAYANMKRVWAGEPPQAVATDYDQ